MFQFLLGTLKTKIRSNQDCFSDLVSIPLRYAKNDSHAAFPLSLMLFQFLLGTLKTRTQRVFRVRIVLVSIPLRYAKNPVTAT